MVNQITTKHNWKKSNWTEEIVSILNEWLTRLLLIEEDSNGENINLHENKWKNNIWKIGKDTVNAIVALLEKDSDIWIKKLKEISKQHEFFHMYVWKSDFAMHAFSKPYWYAGDMHLMKKICEKDMIWESNFEIINNRSFLSYPTAEGVKQRAKSLFETLKQLPNGSKVVNLACGPALEVQGFLEMSDKDIEFTLIDNDPLTLKYLEEQNLDERVNIVAANAFKLNSKRLSALCWNQKVDLAYSSWLFDYIPDKFAPRITKALFDQVKPWGSLMIGNYLEIADSNPHTERQRFFTDHMLDWKLIYRTPEEIESFLDKINPAEYSYHIWNEFFGTNPNISIWTIWFLIVKKI